MENEAEPPGMKKITGAIFVLAGTVLGGSTLVAEAINPSGYYSLHFILAGILGVIGFFTLCVGFGKNDDK